MTSYNISGNPVPINNDTVELTTSTNTTMRKADNVTIVETSPQLATKSSTNQNTWTILTWLIVIFIVIIILAVIAFAIYWSTRPKKENVVCATQSDCSAGQYCSSSGICLAGSGETSGTVCSKNDDCRFGLFCFSGRCGTELSVPLVTACSPLTPPAKFQLKTSIGGTTYYVNIDGSGSSLQAAAPATYLIYSPATEILSVHNGGLITPVGVISASSHNGEMFTSNGAERFMCLSGTNSAAKLTLDCGSVLQYTGTTAAPDKVFFPAVPAGPLTQNCNTFPSNISGRDLTFILEEVV